MSGERRIFCFWTGNNEMSLNRRMAFKSLVENCGCKVELVTPENLGRFLLKEHPLHEAYEYLSHTHKADYLRCYFMHHHGGGYTDIKRTGRDWNPYFDQLENNEQLWGVGYPEPELLQDPQPALCLGACAFVLRPGTPLTSEWHRQLLEVMNARAKALRRHPARHPQDHWGMPPENRLCKALRLGHSRYPLGWKTILGEIFFPLSAKYASRLSYTMHTINHKTPYR